ncbi:deoxyribose-phosphate aldolase [Bosea sp. (in: a-proteobacteria)]|uniref:deoxyribose-phosphate aldolase n=1 Tax=Bosea sp. (in: a-proteobacteria) TaxID=1871050 RepID=UPI00260DC3DE|nr:deoxyribose-phosphate aldolase [Bosea sp. (in: a-proteobacteria)]MCO5090281.1 deoxyribose-phosphate aldolase [Bosea sp. (in: a-proteobacteria)]
MTDAAFARRALSLLDLTDLADDATEEGARDLCRRAVSGPVPVAAVCLWPQFVATARAALGDGPVSIATVVNFPDGDTPIAPAMRETESALEAGADEIDLVLPWRAVLAGQTTAATAMIRNVKTLCDERPLKVILETGEYPNLDKVRTAAELAVAAGADFIKTSTGKTEHSASIPAVRTMLGVIAATAHPVGLKPSGGIRTLADAKSYLDLTDAIMGPDWATPATFRFGASGLYDALVAAIASD